MITKIVVQLSSDSYNSYPGEITFTENGEEVIISVESPHREVSLPTDVFMKILAKLNP